jgi:hypothetical protein
MTSVSNLLSERRNESRWRWGGVQRVVSILVDFVVQSPSSFWLRPVITAGGSLNGHVANRTILDCDCKGTATRYQATTPAHTTLGLAARAPHALLARGLRQEFRLCESLG